MASSVHLLDGDDGSSCSGSAGTYYLSKSHLKVAVLRSADGKHDLEKIEVIARADRGHGYCLNFAASATSKDTFVVQKDNTEHLLTRITSRAEDRSTQIADKIVQTVFEGLKAGAVDPFRSGTEEGPPQLAKAFEGEYDPFNEHETRLFNEGLKDMGFCLYLDDGLRGRRPPIGAYCDNPLGETGREQVLQKANAYASRKALAESAFQRAEGILYRPRLPYTLYLFQNRRPGLKLPGNWALWQSKTVFFENRSPTLAVAIDRTYFSDRKTTLRFAMGVLQDVYIEKDSELANVATIPLKVANSLAKLPGEIIRLRTDVTNRREQLIRAQDQLIAAERSLAISRAGFATELAAAAKGKASTGSTTGGTDQSPARCKPLMEQCMAQGLTASACAIEHDCPEP